MTQIYKHFSRIQELKRPGICQLSRRTILMGIAYPVDFVSEFLHQFVKL